MSSLPHPKRKSSIVSDALLHIIDLIFVLYLPVYDANCDAGYMHSVVTEITLRRS